MKTIRALVLLALTLAAPLPAAGQSDETCIAYMEADAAYEAAEQRAKEACRNAAIPFDDAIAKAGEAVYAATMDAGGPMMAMTHPTKRLKEAERKLDAVSAASNKACETAKSAIIDPASEVWGRTYGRAYRGPTSDIQSVFQKLVLADRERCRVRFGQ